MYFRPFTLFSLRVSEDNPILRLIEGHPSIPSADGSSKWEAAPSVSAPVKQPVKPSVAFTTQKPPLPGARSGGESGVAYRCENEKWGPCIMSVLPDGNGMRVRVHDLYWTRADWIVRESSGDSCHGFGGSVWNVDTAILLVASNCISWLVIIMLPLSL